MYSFIRTTTEALLCWWS